MVPKVSCGFGAGRTVRAPVWLQEDDTGLDTKPGVLLRGKFKKLVSAAISS
jgi:hypothetical protein